MKPKELEKLLKVTIPAGFPVMVKGAPGVGKSDIIAQACEASEAELIIEHPVVSDPTDFKGLPFAKNGTADFLPFGSLRSIINAKQRTVYFLDDLGQAPPSVQAACMQLILARRINGHKVSDQVTFVAATNRHTDRAGVTGILEPVKSRFTSIVELEPDMEDWVAWALKANVPTELIAFIRFRPNLLFDFQPTNEMKNSPCPRTVVNVGRLMQSGIPSEIEYEVYSGSAGEGFAAELMAFLKIFRDLPNPDTVLMAPEKAKVPEDPATLYAICGALSRRSSSQTIDRLIAYANRLPAEFSVLMVRDSVQVDEDVVNNRSYIEWASAHSDVLI
ncbi:MAG: ATP-binding protein [Deltaproteobacteria bacterium]|nr:ATP-binding protein [Deltaproteobacteria bacterium]